MNLRQALKSNVRLALEEDVAGGDITARYFCDPKRVGVAKIITREKCVVAGIEVSEETFRQVDPELALSIFKTDGMGLNPDETVMEIRGRMTSILTAERTALNFIQRLSGIATLTRRFVEAIQGTRAKILDTRKTTPGLRLLEKAAVRAGGGHNYRMGLYDMAMIKDNYFASRSDTVFLQEGIDRLKADSPEIKIEVEADRLEQVREFLKLRGVDRILLDNMSIADMTAAVEINAGRVEMEASGGVRIDTVRKIAETGVDFISVGALTHSAVAVDFSLEVDA